MRGVTKTSNDLFNVKYISPKYYTSWIFAKKLKSPRHLASVQAHSLDPSPPFPLSPHPPFPPQCSLRKRFHLWLYCWCQMMQKRHANGVACLFPNCWPPLSGSKVIAAVWRVSVAGWRYKYVGVVHFECSLYIYPDTGCQTGTAVLIDRRIGHLTLISLSATPLPCTTSISSLYFACRFFSSDSLQ